jgi:hypothetical protein
MSLQLPPAHAPCLGRPSPQDQLLRASNIFGQTGEFKPSCSKDISIGIFFDGTNNNLERDRPLKGHSNIVVLFDTHKEDPEKGYFHYYIPGCGYQV